MKKQLIINADDFGLCEGVNRAIAEAHSNGVLTSTTIMANMPAAKEAVEIAKQLPTLGVGVHLNLTEGTPLSKREDISCLVNDDGEFGLSAGKISLFSIANHKIRSAIETELAAQIQWVIDSGLQPTHLDSHKHLHSFPALFPMVCRLAKRFKIGAVRNTYEPKQLSAIPWPLPSEGGRIRATMVRAMARINRLQNLNQNLLKTKALLGVAHTGKIDVNFFKAAALYNPVSIAEVMTHPGYIDGLDANKTRLVNQRKGEFDSLCDKRTKQFLEDAKIELINYGQL